MIELPSNLDLQLGMPRHGVIINGNSTIGRDKFAILCQHQRIDFQRARFDTARSRKQFSNRLGQLRPLVLAKVCGD